MRLLQTLCFSFFLTLRYYLCLSLFQITIDISAPHEGSVHDGIRGEPEIDYQQDQHIDVHWEGFFDRESGVEFYQYIFSDHCLSNEEFNNSTKVRFVALKEIND